MKKILVILNAELLSFHLTKRAIMLAKDTGSFLQIVLINDTFSLEEDNYKFPNDLVLTQNNLTGKSIREENTILMNDNLSLLLNSCQSEHIMFSIDPDREPSVDKLIEYSRFCDLILADADENIYLCHIKELLVHAHCPVYLSSPAAESPKNIVFAYDGSEDCMHAFRMFAYLFSELRNLPCYLLRVQPKGETLLPNEENIKSWLGVHFPKIQIQSIAGDLPNELINFIKSFYSPLVVMGSFGRSALSRLIRKSLASSIIGERVATLFNAHE